MPKNSKNPQLARFDVKTEACPKMTRRWRREVLPELLAWLGLHITRGERALAHAEQAAKAAPKGAVGDAVIYYSVRLRVLRDLAAQVPDKWDDYLWWQCAQVVVDAGTMPPVKPTHQPQLPMTEEKPIKPKG